MGISVDPHPALRAAAFETRFSAGLGSSSSPFGYLLSDAASAPLQRDEALRQAVRDMLRHGGYKPTGRGKPASEYLVRAAADGGLHSINTAVDACNAVSLHSGFPISVVDGDLLAPPLRIAEGDAGATYVFNPAGHEIDVSGLVCLHDAAGPCANAVKDSHRTKTRPETVYTISIIWGAADFEDRLAATMAWYRNLLEGEGATTALIELGHHGT
jgi:DNA/RNA-binding domain of Phe-tRNA-synthetase-like protein